MQKLLPVDRLIKLDIAFHIRPEPSNIPVRSYLASGLTVEKVRFPVLYHINPNRFEINTVKNIKYFFGKVTIDSCAEAISYARLLTSPLTESRMGDFIGYEVLLAKYFHESDWLGLDPGSIKNESGYCGLISEEDAKKIDF